MSAVCLCVICGLPGAGKTTLARVLKDEASSRGWRTLLVTYDELIPARPWKEAEWKQFRKTLLLCLERFLRRTLPDPSPAERASGHSEPTDSDHTLFNQTVSDETHCGSELPGLCERFEQMLQQQNDFLSHSRKQSLSPPPLVLLLDDNFYYQSMRHQIQQLAKRLCLGFVQVHLECPLEVCLQRNRERSVRVPDDVLISVCERMEPPNHLEQYTHTLQSESRLTHTDLQQLMEMLAKAMENPLSPEREDPQQEVDRLICSSSVLHQADQRSRRLVSDSMRCAREAHFSPKQLKALAQHLNEQKNVFLQQLKSQPLPDPLDPIKMDKLMGVFECRATDILNKHLRKGT